MLEDFYNILRFYWAEADPAMAAPATPAPVLAIEDITRAPALEEGAGNGLAAIGDESEDDGYEAFDADLADTLVDEELALASAEEPAVELEAAPASAEKPEVEPPVAEKPEVNPPVAEKPEVKPPVAEEPEVKPVAEEPEVKPVAEEPEVNPLVKHEAAAPVAASTNQAEGTTGEAAAKARAGKLSRKKPHVFSGDQEDIDPKRQRIRYLVQMRLDLVRPHNRESIQDYVSS